MHKRPWPESARTAKKWSDDLQATYARSRYRDIFYPFTSNQGSMDRIVAFSPKAESASPGCLHPHSSQQYRRDNKCLPEKMDALVPKYLRELPKDPFADQPFRFLRDGKEAVVISSGARRHWHGAER